MMYIGRSAAVIVLLTTVLVRPHLVSAAPLQVQTKNGVPYVTGGVSDDERAAIVSMTKDFNLKVTLAIKTGEFLGEATVHIRNAQGVPVLEASTDGPLFFAKLTPGAYTVTVEREGKQMQKSAQVTSGHQTDLMFSWTQE